MHYRFLFCAVFILLLSVPASGVLYPFPNGPLEKAAAKIKEKDYKAAKEAALEAPQGGAREFLAGISAFRLEEWDEASRLFGQAVSGFPLLADFALYYQAQSLFNLSRFAEVMPALHQLIKNYPESPILRNGYLLQANTYFTAGDFKGAFDSYQKFIEKYPSGSDSLSASHKLALCREQLGDLNGAVASLRSIWLNYPASAVAGNAEADMQRLAAKGVTATPYSAEELFKRGVILYDLRKFDQALKTFSAIQPKSDELNCKISLKSGQTLFRKRQCKQAELTLSALEAKKLKKGLAEEVLYWLARSLDKNGKSDEAVVKYLRLVELNPNHELADNALYEASLIRKSQKRGSEAQALLNRLLNTYPASALRQNAIWEIGWDSYQSRNYAGAAEQFRKLQDFEQYRDRALYWYGRALASAGSPDLARTAFATLLKDFPSGFYATMYRQDARIEDPPFVLPRAVEHTLIPAWLDRAKALVAFGLYNEARMELSVVKKKPTAKNGSIAAIAELYLAMNDYNGAFALYLRDPPVKLSKENMQAWGFFFPLAYNDFVTAHAARNGLPVSLVYSIIRAESSYSPTALSPVGAVGLMQLMPATAAAIGKGRQITTDSLLQPGLNISLGTRHLKDLLLSYKNDPVYAIAAYNAGSGNVNRWRKTFGGLKQDEFIENIPFGETREYVKKVLAASALYRKLYQLDRDSVVSPASPPEEERVAGN